MISCDTGFFVAFLQGNPKALSVWELAIANSETLVFNVISLYELQRLVLKGEVLQKETEVLIKLLPSLCQIVYLDEANKGLLEKAAKLGHGNGLSMADSLIFATALVTGARVLYTSDSDMAKYKGKLGPEVVLL